MPITAHHIDEINELIAITRNEAGNRYTLERDRGGGEFDRTQIRFQHGPLHEPGALAGLTTEALLAVCLDRMDLFQSGKHACEENALTREHIAAAISCQKLRGLRRAAKGIEGTHKVDAEAEGASAPGTPVPGVKVQTMESPAYTIETPGTVGELQKDLENALRKQGFRVTSEHLNEIEAHDPKDDDKTPVDTKSASKELSDYLSARSKTPGGKKPVSKKD